MVSQCIHSNITLCILAGNLPNIDIPNPLSHELEGENDQYEDMGVSQVMSRQVMNVTLRLLWAYMPVGQWDVAACAMGRGSTCAADSFLSV